MPIEKFLITILASVLAFCLVLMVIPHILLVGRAKKLFESTSQRRIHTKPVPPLGGVAIFFGFTLSLIVATKSYPFDSLRFVLLSVILLFFLGLKDDLLGMSPRKKFIIQVFAAVLLIDLDNLCFSNLHGLFGIYEINHLAGIFITLFIIVAIINAFNFIDGIDGLASGLGIMSSLVFGIWFFLAGHIQLAIMSFTMAGSLGGFFVYNVFGKKNKLFMGDTGSQILGLVVAVLVIKFNELNIAKSGPYAIMAAPSFSFAIVIIPLIDSLKVMIIRILNGRSPLLPDKRHVHHVLLKIVPSHLFVLLIIISTNAFLVGLVLFFDLISFNNINYQFLSIFFTGFILVLIPSMIVRYKTTVSDEKADQSKLPQNIAGQ